MRIPLVGYRYLGIGLVLSCVPAGMCDDAPSPAPATSEHVGPPLTPGAGVTTTVIARGSLGAFHVRSTTEQFRVEMRSDDETDVQVHSGIAMAGSFSGWHTHRGPVLLVIKAGTLTVYDAADATCRPRVYGPGTSFFEGTTPHNVRNEGAVAVEYATVSFMPAGGPSRVEADFPPHCPP